MEAIQAYELTGRRLDAWQKSELVVACGERADHRWAAFEVALVDPRQNGKDEEILARELAGLFVWGERLIGHSAHLFDTAMEHLERLVSLIEDVPEFSKRVRKVNRSHGSEGITLRSGARIRFRARTRSGSFRGFTGDCVIFNEAMDLPDPLIGSIMPVLSARSMLVPGPQVWYAASAVDQETMPNGLVLTRLRDAALAGGNGRLAYFEHSAGVREWLLAHGLPFDESRPEIEQITEEMLADPEVWAQANPALGERISHEHVLTELRSPSMSSRQFAIERLGIGDPPFTGDELALVIDREVWDACGERDQRNRIVGGVSFGVATNLEQSWGSVGVAGWREDGLVQVAVVRCERGAGWIVGECERQHEQYLDARFVVDRRGPAANLIAPLELAGLRVVEPSTGEFDDACQGLVTDAVEGSLRFPFPQPELSNALTGARQKGHGDRWRWGSRPHSGVDISSLVAVTLARWGCVAASSGMVRGRVEDYRIARL